MSLNTVDVQLDRTRQLLFRIQDLRDLCRRLGGLTMIQLLERLAAMDLDTIMVALQMGLRHEDKRLTPDRVGELVQQHIDRGGTMADILNALNEAIEASGVIRRRTEDGQPGESGT